MRTASNTSSFAIGPRTGKIWRIQSRRSRKKRRHADPTSLDAIRCDLPSEEDVRAHLSQFVDANRANRALGIGLLAAKLLDSRRPPRDLPAKINKVFGVTMTGRELRWAANDARTMVQDELRRRFDSSPNWKLRWLPRIEAAR